MQTRAISTGTPSLVALLTLGRQKTLTKAGQDTHDQLARVLRLVGLLDGSLQNKMSGSI